MAKSQTDKPKTPAPTKRIVLSATNKGGVGKSFFMTHFVQWLKFQIPAVKFRAFDPDHANRTLMRQHPDVTSFLDVDDELNLDEVVRCLTDYELAVTDGLGSQQKKTFGAWVRDVNLFEIAPTIGAAITYVLVVKDNREVIEQALETAEQTPAGCDFVVVVNRQGLRTDQPLTLWNQSTTRKLLLGRGAIEIDMPSCPKPMADLLTHIGVPAHQFAANAMESVSLDTCAHQRFVNLTRAIDENLDRAARLLLPASALASRG